MNFKNWIIEEMPINQLQLVGGWDKGTQKPLYGYKPSDINILSNTAGTDKIRKKWSNTHQTFDFYFLRSKEGYKHVEVGEVTSQWVKENLNLDVVPKEETITVIFTNNTGTERIPMTAWAIAHRLGHAIRRGTNSWETFSRLLTKDFSYILENVYHREVKTSYGYPSGDSDKLLKNLAHAVGSMKSARDSNLVRFSEFQYELLAQYLITGKVTYLPLPRVIGSGRYKTYSRISNEDLEEWSGILQGNADNHAHYLDTILTELEGKLYVM